VLLIGEPPLKTFHLGHPSPFLGISYLVKKWH